MRWRGALCLAALLATALFGGRAAAVDKVVPASPIAAQRASEIVAALAEYRTKLGALLPLYEEELARATERLQQRREFLERGVISRKEFEATEAAVAKAQGKIEDTHRAISDVDHATAEAATARALAGLTPLGRGGYEQTATLIRFNGPFAWSLKAGVARLEQFFLTHFGRTLPVSAYGQTPLHERMGLDHRDALDIALHPNSPEGRTLMEYLREAGIPFIAAWGAVPGSTSGAHIHVGQPSPRVAVTR